jgi:hypothetical protein
MQARRYYKENVLDELPSLEIAATAVALVLMLRAAQLSGAGAGLLRRRRRSDSRARDLVGIVIIAGAALYALRVERASTWFLAACGVAIVAQLVGFYLRTAARARAAAEPSIEISNDGGDEDSGDEDELYGCPSCGHGTLIELDDTTRLLGGLSQLTPVTAVVCPRCGALSGQVEDPAKILVGEAHGTSLRKSPIGDDDEALQEPTEHDG